MEIQKIFSNIEDPEENLYSVILSEEEYNLFSESRKEVWEREKKEEIERNKERDKLLKKMPKEDIDHANKMWKDTDTAGRIGSEAMDRDNALVGAGLGYLTAKAGKHIAKKKGKSIKHGKLITVGAMLTGTELAVKAGAKRSERIAQDIWNEGDRRLMNYLKSDKKSREKMREEYEPISPLWRKGDKN